MKKHILLSGGLGNQLFQYVLYMSFKKRGLPCVLDISEYIERSDHNGFELARVMGINESLSLFPVHNRYIYKIYKYLFKFKYYFEDPIFQFNDLVFNNDKEYISGCWLSLRYLEGIEDEIRKKFVFTGISDTNSKLAQEMQRSNSVSIHIRRGDYLKIPRYNVCTEEYYDRAIREICKYIDNPKFYIFSDDPEWCAAFFKKYEFDYLIINHNRGENSYQDMYLMSNCKNNIIANSTFSWWGAWLNSNIDKIIIGPSKWISTKEIRIDLPNSILLNV